MRKLFLILTVFVSFGVGYAQAYEELDLLGGWELVSCQGHNTLFTGNNSSYDAPSEHRYMYLGEIFCDDSHYDDNGHEIVNHGEHIMPGINIAIGHDEWLSGYGLLYKDRDKWDGDHFYSDYDSMTIENFFISGGNKLNIIFRSEYAPSLKFIITSLDDSELRLRSYDGKCTVVYKRITEPNAVADIASEQDGEESYYNINGMRQNKPERGINIVRKGNTVRKVAVK